MVEVKVIERPPRFSFSKNQIRYVFQSVGSTGILFLQVRLFYFESVKENPKEVLLETFNLKADNQGKVMLYIDAYLDSLLEYTVPGTGANGSHYTNANDQFKVYYVAFRGVTSIDDPAEFDLNELFGHARIVIKGGLEDERFSRDNYFLYHNVNKRFFTWNDRKLIYPTERTFLTALLRSPIAADGEWDLEANFSFSIQFHLIGDAGSSDTLRVPIASIDACYLAHIEVTPSRHEIIDYFGAERLVSYTVSVVRDADDSVIAVSEPIFIDYRPVYKYHDLIYQNSLGGFDTIRVNGSIATSVTREFVEVDGGLPLDSSNAIVKRGQLLHTGFVRNDVYKGDAGWQLDEEMQDTRLEILTSQGIYQIIDGRFCQVVITQKSVDLRASGDKKWSFPIEWQLAFNKHSFTPKYIQLGIAPDTEQY